MNYNNNIERLIYFYTACQYTSFSKAAEHLKVYPSTISKNISSLENELGIKLFDRKFHAIELTDKGHELLKHVRIIVERLNLISQFNNEIDNREVQKIKIIGGENALTTLLINNLKNFDYNKDKYLLDISSSHEAPIFYQNDMQVAITGYIENAIYLKQNYIATFNLGLYASKKYLDLNGTPQTPEDLDNHKLIIFENHNVPFNYPENWALSIGQNHKNLRKPFIVINSVPMTFSAARLSLGIAVLAKETFYLRNSDLVEVLPGIQSPQLKIYYTYHENNKDNHFVLTLHDHILKFSKLKNWY